MAERPENSPHQSSGIPDINIRGTQVVPASVLRQTGSLARNAIGHVIAQSELNSIHQLSNTLPADSREHSSPNGQIISEKVTSFRLTIEIPEIRSVIINFRNFLEKGNIDTAPYAQANREINVDAWIGIITAYQRTDMNTIDETYHRSMWVLLCRLAGLLEHVISISKKYPHYHKQFASLTMGIEMIFGK